MNPVLMVFLVLEHHIENIWVVLSLCSTSDDLGMDYGVFSAGVSIMGNISTTLSLCSTSDEWSKNSCGVGT